MDDRDAFGQESLAGVAVAQRAVKAYNTIAVGWVVPQHSRRGCTLSAQQGAPLHIPCIVGAERTGGMIGGGVAQTH